jgi:hypothetical protein
MTHTQTTGENNNDDDQGSDSNPGEPGQTPDHAAGGGREGGEERRLTHSIVLYRLLGYCRYSPREASTRVLRACGWMSSPALLRRSSPSERSAGSAGQSIRTTRNRASVSVSESEHTRQARSGLRLGCASSKQARLRTDARAGSGSCTTIPHYLAKGLSRWPP